MKIAISGNSGFIGRHLTDFFSDRGDVVVPLKHSMFRLKTDDKLKEALIGCDVVINLAGTTINQRWTSKAKRKIKNSRVYTTRRLVSILNEMPVKPKLFISASAVGIYPDKGIYSETSTSEGTGLYSMGRRGSEIVAGYTIGRGPFWCSFVEGRWGSAEDAASVPLLCRWKDRFR